MMQKLKSSADVPSTRWMERVLKMTRTDGILKNVEVILLFLTRCARGNRFLETDWLTDRQTDKTTDRQIDTVRYRSDYPSLKNSMSV